MVLLRRPNIDISHEERESDVSERGYFSKDYFRSVRSN
jgi:hypothetical protein